MNMTAWNGRITPAFKQFVINTTDKYHYAVKVVDYKAPAGTGGQPRQYCAQARTVYRFEDGTQSDDVTATSSTAFNDVVQGMVVCDVPEDGTPGTFTQGAHPGLLVTFGDGVPVAGQTGVQYRLLDTDASTPWSAASENGTTYLTAWQIVRAGPDLYAATDAGRCSSLGEYRVSKCPAGNNPVLAASWGNGFEVGGPEWKITNLAAIGDSVVVGKPDGLYYYSDLTKRFENVLKHYEIVPHALNGKVTQSVTGGVIYTTFDGHAYFFDGVSTSEITPSKLWGLAGRDIGASRITAVCDTGDSIEMFSELGYQTTQNANIRVLTVTSAGASTDIGTNMVDGSFNTGGDISSLAATSFIDVWADIPFEGVQVYVTRSSNTTATAVIGSVSYSSANNTFTADPNGFIDHTRLAQSGATSPGGSFMTMNMPPSASSGQIMGKSLNFGSLQQAVSFTYTSGDGNTSPVVAKYGMRIAMSGAALDASTVIDEIEIIPTRAGMPNNGIYSTTTNFTARNNSVLVGHLISMKRKATNQFVPRDRFAVYSYPGVWGMAAYSGRLGQASGGQNLGQSLILWGRNSLVAISKSPTGDEIRSRYPLLAQVGTASPGPFAQIAFEWDGGNPYKMKRLDNIYIDTRYVQPLDQTELFAQFDDQDIVSLGVYRGGPLSIPVNQAPFRYLNLWLGFKQNATTVADTPQFVEPFVLEFDWVGEIGESPRDRAGQVPPAT